MRKIFKNVVVIVITAVIAAASACIASRPAKNTVDPEQIKVWVEDNIVYLEAPDGNVWAHEVK